MHEDLVDESLFKALRGDVGAEHLGVLALGGLHGRGDGGPDVAREEGDCRVLQSLRRLVSRAQANGFSMRTDRIVAP